MFDIPYGYRVAWLIFFMLIMVHYDWRKHGAQSRRWKEYLFILGVSAIGIVYMLLVDGAGGAISREYYYYMRDVPEEGPFRWYVAKQSVESGFPFGAVCGAVLVMANNLKRELPPVSWRRLLLMVCLPMVCGVICAPFSAALGVLFDPLHFGAKLAPLLGKEPDKMQHFLITWGVTIGVYAGGIAGLLWACTKVMSERRALHAPAGQAAPVAPPEAASEQKAKA